MLDIICSGFFIVLSAVLYAATLLIPGATEWDVVGSRLVPQIYVLGLAFCSFVVFICGVVRVVRSGARTGRISREGLEGAIERNATVIVVFASLLAWVALILFAGFYASTGAFLLFLTWFLAGMRFTIPSVAVSIVMPILIYFVFARGLHVLLPSGIFFS
ncbi:MAG: tripartite tricarboxylate transporter TctB family protein [Sutterellaceae bacterium]|nr:tripartite tricarboxylate transporter TctB family protein [Sutterellaceae bacterium]MDD7442972.1 tripartite tricarboxylate transporter TctB family protein [Sutterellaceae bacterium]MDY2868633.1 tripartite tricarboxylate transporter TctB family protein [Mesosutterella sp.]